MHLILGPPGSGKSAVCLSKLRKALRAQLDTCRLIVPTATMAEHLRNELAREGFVFKPSLVETFTKFVGRYCDDTLAAGSGGIAILVSEVLARTPLAHYEAVRDFAGFRASIVQFIEEFSSAGGTLDALEKAGAEPDLRRIYEGVVKALKQRGLFLRSAQLGQAADKIAEDGCPGVEDLLFAGFYSFTPPELKVIHKLSRHVKLTVALAEWTGAQPAIDSLLPAAETVEKLAPSAACGARTLSVAPKLDAEVAEVARRIIQARSNGRAWRDMGVLVRSEANYVPALRSAFRRFGIPARYYFSAPLSDAPVVRYYRAVMDALLAGWDHLKVLRALRLPGSPLETSGLGDQFEFAVLEQAPGTGLEALRPLADGILEPLEALAPWTKGKVFPVAWAERMRSMRRLAAPLDLKDNCSHETALLWREYAKALDGFEAACDTAASALDPGVPLDCKSYWDAVQTVLAASELRVPDHRRDVVHVIDAFEARQWSLPIVFVCGLLEKEFPRYQSEDAILPDTLRRRLQAAGIPLRTSTQRQADERFLFDLALTRAREALVLSYPKLNAKGDANLPSFFLQHARPFVEDIAADPRPLPTRARAPEPSPFIASDEARGRMASRHAHYSPTSIEAYLQCPFHFFASKTLKLKGTPEQPWDRLNAMVQGSVVHRVLERSHREHGSVAKVFGEVFPEYCREANVPEGYRTEAIRLELLHNLEMMESDSRLARGATSLYEQEFQFPLEDGTILRGIIDRIELDQQNNAIVIDYKYKSKQSTERTKKGHAENTAVQGGLYLLAAEKLGYRPAGMVYCGVKREVHYAGWMLSPHYPDIKQTCGSEELHAITQQAREDTLNAIAGVREGIIAPKPADEMRCAFCDFAHACRYEVAALEQVKKAGQ